MRGIDLTRVATNIPLPLDTALIRAELDSLNPAVALTVALVAFHGLTGKQVRELQPTDIVDGRLLLDGRDIPLAAPVRTRLTAWLDYRNQTWPASANPQLLINRRTAPRLVPGGYSFPWGTAPYDHAPCARTASSTRSTPRRICDLFGLSITGATRFLATVEHPDLVMDGERGPRP